ncbi:ethylene-responsive transcription factor ERF119-like [Henckelia pumila]|uniref:ethylene-responsive transcription factor ERF119-like n=1 Tax=Henckelia pumila TaxID=405737 RepID=UPI003C6DBB67
MPAIQRLVSLNQETVSEKHSNEFESTSIVRKVRIICSDPYATDSSEDEGIFSQNGKCFVHEIHLPISSCQVLIPPVTKGSVQGSNNGGQNPRKKRVLAFRGKKPNLTSRKRKGNRQREWGKCAAEIRVPAKQKRICLGTYRSAEEASRAHKTKRIEFQASANSPGCGEEKMPLSLVLSKCANDQNQNLVDVSTSLYMSLSTASRAPHVSPSSLIAFDFSTSALGTNAKENVARKAIVVEKEFTEHDRMDKELMAMAQTGKELVIELELDKSIMIDVNDFTRSIDDFANGFEDLPICGLLDEDKPGMLPDFDFNFDFGDYSEAFAWIDEAPATALTNEASPLNIACP